jgi:hypothetical protein
MNLFALSATYILCMTIHRKEVVFTIAVSENSSKKGYGVK